MTVVFLTISTRVWIAGVCTWIAGVAICRATTSKWTQILMISRSVGTRIFFHLFASIISVCANKKIVQAKFLHNFIFSVFFNLIFSPVFVISFLFFVYVFPLFLFSAFLFFVLMGLKFFLLFFSFIFQPYFSADLSVL